MKKAGSFATNLTPYLSCSAFRVEMSHHKLHSRSRTIGCFRRAVAVSNHGHEVKGFARLLQGSHVSFAKNSRIFSGRVDTCRASTTSPLSSRSEIVSCRAFWPIPSYNMFVVLR